MQLPTTEKSKALVTLVGGLVAVTLVIVVFSKIFKGISAALERLGFKDSKKRAENKAVIDNAVNRANQAGAKSYWSPNFYKKAPPGSALVTRSLAESLAKQLWDSVGYIYDTPAKGVATIKQLRTGTQLSFIADVFYLKYATDLITWLNDKYDVLGQREYLREIIDYVNSLPPYKA